MFPCGEYPPTIVEGLIEKELRTTPLPPDVETVTELLAEEPP
jgi:hypothetical protein